MRAWCHTHPGDSPAPSTVDEETFQRVFGRCDWAVMFILARGGQTYARLRFNVGPGGEAVIPVEITYREPFEGSDHPAWKDEYERHVHVTRWETVDCLQRVKPGGRHAHPRPRVMEGLEPAGADPNLEGLVHAAHGWLDPWEDSY